MKILLRSTLYAVFGIGIAGCSSDKTGTTQDEIQSVTETLQKSEMKTEAMKSSSSYVSFKEREVGTYVSQLISNATYVNTEISQEQTCAATIYRFIEGQDQKPVVMTAEQKAAELNDVFAKLLLCPGESSASLMLITDILDKALSLIHISEPTRPAPLSRMPSSA